jgi:hypothetical protein
MHRPLGAVVALALWIAPTGCQLVLGGLSVDTVASATQKPSNVAVFLSVKDGAAAASDLQPDNFKVYEDGLPLNSKEVSLVLLDEHASVAHHALVLVDLSGPVKEGGALALLAGQLVPFIERLRSDHEVSVWGFDGSEKLTRIAAFQRSSKSSDQPVSKQDLAPLTTFSQKDPSSNLNSAVTLALKELDANVRGSSKSLALGTLVIVARGPDLAGRSGEDIMLQKLDETPHQVFAVTVGPEDDTRLAELLGTAGYSQVRLFENLEVGLGDVARQVESNVSRYYLLSYCSPARAGNRNLLVEVTTRDGDGTEVRGTTELQFSATGFKSGCDSKQTPKFSDKKPPATDAAVAGEALPAPPASDNAGDGEPTSATIPPPPSDDYAE